jgi:quinohemoprotein ethanol dehydrogenase
MPAALRSLRSLSVVTILLAPWACADRPAPPVSTVVDDATLAAEGTGANWLAYGRTYSEQRHSPLTQVSDANVSDLAVDWYMDLRAVALVGTPLVVDGVMYFEAGFNVVHAVDAATGEVLWTHDPRVVDQEGVTFLWDVSRGLAFWEGKVYTATIDGRLIALDAASGEPIWEVDTLTGPAQLFISGAPKVFRGKVVIGNGGTETGPARGYLTAYDAETGEQVWRFWTVPGNPADGFENDAMAMAAETWTGEWWRFGGGGTVWNGITYDPEFNQLIFGTGNGAPWNQKIRSPEGGDNLFLCSIVAVDADTGEYRWHYQTVPGETWDYNSNMDIVLADLTVDGREVKAAMHAPKNGFFYVVDRSDGTLLSAEPFTRVTWATHVDMETGRPVEVPGVRYEDGEETIWPGAVGAHSWHPMSYNPGTGLVYIPAIDLPGSYDDRGIDLANWESPDGEFDAGVAHFAADAPPEAGTSSLKAWDPVAQRLAWEVPTPGVWNAGTLTTAGNLVFQGTAEGHLVAYSADTGEELWRFDLGSGISAPPVTYSVGGTQYVSVLVGWGASVPALAGSLAAQHGWAYGAQPRRLVTFSLGGDATLPPSPPPVQVEPLAAPDFVVDAQLAAQGEQLYRGVCVICHGPVGVSGGVAPDLRASSVVLSEEAFVHTVISGERKELGMPQFDYSVEELRGVQHYIRSLVSGEG